MATNKGIEHHQVDVPASELSAVINLLRGKEIQFRIRKINPGGQSVLLDIFFNLHFKEHKLVEEELKKLFAEFARKAEEKKMILEYKIQVNQSIRKKEQNE